MQNFFTDSTSAASRCSWKLAGSLIYKTMRITAAQILLMVITLGVSFAREGYSQQVLDRKVSLDITVRTLKDALTILETQTGIKFVYSGNAPILKEPLTIMASEQTLGTVLDKLLEPLQIRYVVKSQTHIVLKRKVVKENKETGSVEVNTPSEPLSKDLDLQTITGTVSDGSTKQPMPGVNIVVKGTINGTTTNANGNFSISAPENAILLISFIGYKTQEISVGTRSSISISLEADLKHLDEVVVVGYGTQKKRDLTGAISTIDTDKVNQIPVAGIDQALQGQAAGVMVTQNNGSPGAGIQVRIRGIGTIGDSDPLYVIDGVPTKEAVNNLNTTDIESISILKDASAAAIYGARAANGVVLITTKKGKFGVTQVNLDAQYGIQNVSNKLKLLNAAEYGAISDEALVNAGRPAVWNNSATGAGTDWQNVIFRDAPFQKYDFSVNSGNDKTRYVFGLGYYGQDGIVRFSDLTRYNLRFNLTSKVTDKLTIGTNLNLSRVSKNLVDTEINGVVRAAIFQPPTVDVYNPDGSFAGPGPNEGDAQNPLGMAQRSQMSTKRNQVFGNLFAEYRFVPGLTFKTSLGVDVYSDLSKNFDPTFSEGNANRTINSLTQQNINYSDLIWENTLSYSKVVAKDHNINVLVGNTLQDVKNENLYGYREGFTNNEPYLQYLDAGSVNDKARSNLTEWSLASFYGRINYDFSNKYLFSANIRYDGSSRFGKSNRWGVFPSASAGWRVSNESFFKVPVIDDLKLRASWGQLGNQDIGLYAFTGPLSQTFYTLGKDQSLNVGYSLGSDFNPDVKWETTTQLDFGLDLSAFKGRLSITADYYIKKTTDMLLVLPQPKTSGFSSSGYENLGEVQNKGFEFQAGWEDQISDFRYGLSANISTFKNKVISLGTRGEPITAGLFFDMSTRTEVGHPIRSFYGYLTDGIFQTKEEIQAHATQQGAQPGDIRFKDINNDHVINGDDRTFIGNPYPDFFYGLNASAGYKKFDLSLLFQGQRGNDVYNGTAFWLTNSGYNFNKGTQILDRWTGPGTSSSQPRLTTSDPNQNSRASDRYIEDGSYLRLKNLQFGYTLSENALNKLRIKKARVYFSVYNLLTFTKYTGYDPEVGSARSGDRTVGFDEVTYPQNRNYMLGVSLTF